MPLMRTRTPPVVLACPQCGTPFKTWTWRLMRGDGKFCSPACQHQSLFKDPESRFWAKVNKTQGCWLWTAGRSRQGYGQFSVTRTQPIPAHRYAWMLLYGPIQEGIFVCHHCDNPTCVRPSHLFLGSPLDNMRDKINKGRRGDSAPKNPRNGINHHNAKLNTEGVLRIRRLSKQGIPQREIAMQLNVSQRTVLNVIHGRIWAHVT